MSLPLLDSSHSEQVAFNGFEKVFPKHIFILSSSGKPIFSKFGDEQMMANTFGLIQAVISVVSDTISHPPSSSDHRKQQTEKENDLLCIKAGNRKIIYFIRDNLYFITISSLNEPELILNIQLQFIYSLILMILTFKVHGLLNYNSKKDIRALLGTDTNQLLHTTVGINRLRHSSNNFFKIRCSNVNSIRGSNLAVYEIKNDHINNHKLMKNNNNFNNNNNNNNNNNSSNNNSNIIDNITSPSVAFQSIHSYTCSFRLRHELISYLSSCLSVSNAVFGMILYGDSLLACTNINTSVGFRGDEDKLMMKKHQQQQKQEGGSKSREEEEDDESPSFTLATTDILLLTHFIANTPSLHQHYSENWVPICLPTYNAKALLQAYICDLNLPLSSAVSVSPSHPSSSLSTITLSSSPTTESASSNVALSLQSTFMQSHHSQPASSCSSSSSIQTIHYSHSLSLVLIASGNDPILFNDMQTGRVELENYLIQSQFIDRLVRSHEKIEVGIERIRTQCRKKSNDDEKKSDNNNSYTRESSHQSNRSENNSSNGSSSNNNSNNNNSNNNNNIPESATPLNTNNFCITTSIPATTTAIMSPSQPPPPKSICHHFIFKKQAPTLVASAVDSIYPSTTESYNNNNNNNNCVPSQWISSSLFAIDGRSSDAQGEVGHQDEVQRSDEECMDENNNGDHENNSKINDELSIGRLLNEYYHLSVTLRYGSCLPEYSLLFFAKTTNTFNSTTATVATSDIITNDENKMSLSPLDTDSSSQLALLPVLPLPKPDHSFAYLVRSSGVVLIGMASQETEFYATFTHTAKVEDASELAKVIHTYLRNESHHIFQV